MEPQSAMTWLHVAIILMILTQQTLEVDSLIGSVVQVIQGIGLVFELFT